jgi:hypothetical protein
MEGLNPAWSMDTVFVSVLRCCPVKAEAMVWYHPMDSTARLDDNDDKMTAAR